MELIISIIALVVAVMALPTVLKMICGKPKLEVFFDCSKGYKLWCWIRNMPINSKTLIWLGVERRSQEFDTVITITDEDGVIVSWLPYGSISSDDVRRGVVEVKSKYDGRAFLKDQDDKYSATVLKVGLYRLVLELWGNGRKLLRKEKQFCVHQNYPFVEWVNNK